LSLLSFGSREDPEAAPSTAPSPSWDPSGSFKGRPNPSIIPGTCLDICFSSTSL
jgi:hypothetical protein